MDKKISKIGEYDVEKMEFIKKFHSDAIGWYIEFFYNNQTTFVKHRCTKDEAKTLTE